MYPSSLSTYRGVKIPTFQKIAPLIRSTTQSGAAGMAALLHGHTSGTAHTAQVPVEVTVLHNADQTIAASENDAAPRQIQGGPDVDSLDPKRLVLGHVASCCINQVRFAQHELKILKELVSITVRCRLAPQKRVLS